MAAERIGRRVDLGILVALLIGGALVLGCVTRPIPPTLAKEEVEQAKDDFASRRIELLIRDRSRLLAIEYAIAVSAAPRCGKLVRPHPGVLLTEPESFEDAALRQEVERRLASTEGVTVAAVVDGSGFDRAGIRTGDRLQRANGRRIRSADDFAKQMLESADRTGVAIEFARGGEDYRATVPLDAGCPIRVSMASAHALTTHQPIRLHISVPVELVQTLERDLLASVIAHEVAHALFDLDDETIAQREARADREGLLIAARAGFEVSGMVGYWEQIAAEYPWLVEADFDPGRQRSDTEGRWSRLREWSLHDDIANRLPKIRRYVAAIEAELAAAQAEASTPPAEAPTALSVTPNTPQETSP